MRIQNIITKLTAAVVATTAMICIENAPAEEQIAPERQKHVATGPEVESYQLTISTTNSVFGVGKRWALTVSLRNLSTNTVKMARTSSWFNLYYFEVLGPDGKSAPLTEWGKRAGVNGLNGETMSFVQDLRPGEQFDMPFSLNEMFQMTEPGEYTITVTQKPWSQQNNPEKLLRVPSAPLKIQIVELPKPTSPDNGPTNKVNH